MDEREQEVANIRARIAALRSRIGLGLESFEATQTHPQPVVVKPKSEQTRSVERPRAPKIEPDWDAIAKLTAKNDAEEAAAIEKIEPAVATEPPKIEPDWDAIAKLKAKNNEMAAMKAKLLGKK